MAVFRYKAMRGEREEFAESGTIVAKDRGQAKVKLNKHGFDKVRLKRIRGMAALWARFTADIK